MYFPATGFDNFIFIKSFFNFNFTTILHEDVQTIKSNTDPAICLGLKCEIKNILTLD